MTIRPSIIRFYLIWLILCTIIFAVEYLLIGIINDRGPASFVSILSCLAIFYLVVVSVFYVLPYYAIKIDKDSLTGPSMWGIGWRRVIIPFSEAALNRGNQIDRLLGLYVISSPKGAKIRLLGFSDKQYEHLAALIDERKRLAA